MLEFLDTLVHKVSLSFNEYDDMWQAENEAIKTNEENNPHNIVPY